MSLSSNCCVVQGQGTPFNPRAVFLCELSSRGHMPVVNVVPIQARPNAQSHTSANPLHLATHIHAHPIHTQPSISATHPSFSLSLYFFLSLCLPLHFHSLPLSPLRHLFILFLRHPFLFTHQKHIPHLSIILSHSLSLTDPHPCITGFFKFFSLRIVVLQKSK